MHEASLMRDLMGKITSVARAEGAERVSGVSVRLGALSHMSPEHFREHFETASRDSIARGAALEIEQATDLTAPDAQDIALLALDVEG